MKITNQKCFQGYLSPSALIGDIGDYYYDVVNLIYYEKLPNDTWTEIPSQVVHGFQCGDGADGDVTISVDTNLARDMFYNNLTVNAGIRLNTAGFKVFVKKNLVLNGFISNNGAAGVLDAGGASAPVGSTMSAPVATGPAGGTGVGSAGAAGASGFGEDGGAGGLGSNGAGGAGGNVTANTAANGGMTLFNWVGVAAAFRLTTGAVSASGGAGGGDGVAKGGGGGGAAGIVYVAARTVTVGSGAYFQAFGGDGGAGAGTNCGGGGGGGGGLIIVLSFSNLVFPAYFNVAGGAGGAKTGTGVAGTAGTAGQYFFCQL